MQDEENVVLRLSLSFADRGIPLRSTNVQETVFILVDQFNEELQQNLLLSNYKPGKKWFREFYEQHKRVLKLSYPNIE